MAQQRANLNHKIQKKLPENQKMSDILISQIVKLPDHYIDQTHIAIKQLQTQINPQEIRKQAQNTYLQVRQALKELPKKQTILESALQIKNLFQKKKLSGILSYNSNLQDRLIDSLILMYDIPGYKHSQNGSNSFSRIKKIIKKVLNINQGSEARSNMNKKWKIKSQIKAIINNPAFAKSNFIIQKNQQREQQLKQLQILQATAEDALKLTQIKIQEKIRSYEDLSTGKQKDFYLLFWKIIGSFMSGNLSAPQLERITKSLKKTPLYVQALRKNLGLTTLDTLEMIKESEKQNIFQNYKINSKAIQKSLQLSWSYFENSMLKTIQSNQKMDKAQYEFLKESLDSEQNSMPCCLTARVLCDKPLQIQVYSIKSNVFTIEQRRHIYTKSGFTYKCQNKSDKKIETKMDYIVQIIEPFEQQKMEIGNQDQQGLTIRIIGQIAKRIIKISRQLNIKAIIIGDNSQLVSKNFLNPETRYNRHYVQSAKDKIYSGFKGILFKSIPQVVGFPPYFCPIGWVRFSLFVAANAQEFDKKYKNWLIAYHGTSKDAVLSILSHGFRCATGCFSKNEPMSYYTPSIKYAAMYAQPVYSAKLNKFIQVVLSVRINPQVIHKRKGHTLPNSFRDGDINFNTLWPNQFQWLVKGKSTVRMDQIQIKKKYKKGYEDNIRTQDGVLIYGIMIKISDTQPAYRKIREK